MTRNERQQANRAYKRLIGRCTDCLEKSEGFRCCPACRLKRTAAAQRARFGPRRPEILKLLRDAAKRRRDEKKKAA